MIKLRAMRAKEYPAYCDYFIADYSREIVENYGHSQDVATDLAKQDLQRYFPNGVASKAHSLLCIESDVGGELVIIGYLWHCINVSDSSTFIYDFYIADKYRDNGYGKAAIKHLEALLSTQRIKQIKLRVAYQNQRALALYQAVGFIISGYNMSKNISV